jgi:hypothetical protein
MGTMGFGQLYFGQYTGGVVAEIPEGIFDAGLPGLRGSRWDPVRGTPWPDVRGARWLVIGSPVRAVRGTRWDPR